MSAMCRLDLVDYVESGMKKMFLSWAERYFPLPEHEFDDNHASVRLIGHPVNDVYKFISDKNPDLSLKVIYALNKVQMGKKIGVSDRTIRSNMSKMVRLSIVVISGSDNQVSG